ncbi:hypothetical protein Slin15195_G127270 [Septoria linicola]|uniref:Uncharacterized protein n=1 Tax=Septoria linicola TaxID=215465 RepID=A0A9Q9B5L9_9PEZI|nr:hypothetical protein Slin14017_G083450 [Septoria linicola]USW59408.1 hypothetical protein Slin15195_G127270 [Septoria linicola]
MPHTPAPTRSSTATSSHKPPMVIAGEIWSGVEDDFSRSSTHVHKRYDLCSASVQTTRDAHISEIEHFIGEGVDRRSCLPPTNRCLKIKVKAPSKVQDWSTDLLKMISKGLQGTSVQLSRQKTSTATSEYMHSSSSTKQQPLLRQDHRQSLPTLHQIPPGAKAGVPALKRKSLPCIISGEGSDKSRTSTTKRARTEGPLASGQTSSNNKPTPGLSQLDHTRHKLDIAKAEARVLHLAYSDMPSSEGMNSRCGMKILERAENALDVVKLKLRSTKLEDASVSEVEKSLMRAAAELELQFGKLKYEAAQLRGAEGQRRPTQPSIG